MNDFHGPAAQHVRRANHHRITDVRRDPFGFLAGTGDAVGRLAQTELVQQNLEPFAVLGEIDGVGRCSEDRDTGLRERLRQLQRRLTAELDDDAQHGSARLLDPDQLGHVLVGEGLEIEPVRGIVIGGDGLRIAVHHDRLEARLPQRIGRVDAAIVELDPLADPVGAAAEDHHLVAVRGVGLAFRRD